MIIQNKNYKLDVDIDATKKYYKSNEICDCLPCQNYYAQAKSKFKKLDQFLSNLGADILRPDETCWIETDENINYTQITYTICGKILDGENAEIDNDLSLSATIDSTYVPNSHKKEDWFCVSIFNIKLPLIKTK